MEAIHATSAPGVVPKRIRPWCAYPKKLTYVSGDVNTGTFTLRVTRAVSLLRLPKADQAAP